MLSEYGGTVEYWMGRPFAQAFALYAAISARYGAKPGGPTYADRAIARAMQAASTGGA